MIKYHGAAKDAALLAVKRGEYEVGWCDLLHCSRMRWNTMNAESICSAISATLASMPFIQISVLHSVQVMITSYGMLRKNLEPLLEVIAK